MTQSLAILGGVAFLLFLLGPQLLQTVGAATTAGVPKKSGVRYLFVGGVLIVLLVTFIYFSVPRVASIVLTLLTPYGVIFATLFISVLLVAAKKGKAAVAFVALVALGLVAYWTRPELTCAEGDLACKAAEVQKAAAEATEKLRKEQERQQAVAQAAAATLAQTPGGPQCANVVHPAHVFGITPDDSSVVNTGGKCYVQFSPPSNVCYYVQAFGSSKPSGPFGGCPEAIPVVGNAPNDVERIWASGQPFTADYTLLPRGYASTLVR